MNRAKKIVEMALSANSPAESVKKQTTEKSNNQQETGSDLQITSEAMSETTEKSNNQQETGSDLQITSEAMSETTEKTNNQQETGSDLQITSKAMSDGDPLVDLDKMQKLNHLSEATLTNQQPVENLDFLVELSEDDNDSIEDTTYIPIEESHSDSDVLEGETEEDSEDNLPLSKLKLKLAASKLDKKKYTKKGTLRKRKRYDTSPATRKNQKFLQRKAKHTVKEPCTNKCKKKCIINVGKTRQEDLNIQFWTMTDEQRRAFVLNMTNTSNIKRRTIVVTADHEPRRNQSVRYYLTDEQGASFSVCKKFFLATLGYDLKNDRFIRNLALNRNNRPLIIPRIDNRGRFRKENKFDQKLIEDHIESFEPTISHYRREHAPLRRYLPSDVTIKIMHEDFNRKHGVSISYELYRQVVAKLNISFATLGNEECYICETFAIHGKSTGHDKKNPSPNCVECQSFIKHQERYRAARDEYKTDALKKDGLYVSADLQKVIMIPRCEMFKEVIFAPRLIVFNETFVPLGKSQEPIFAVVWHEAISGRSKDDLISTFYNFFLSVRDQENITIWLDNCASQNKNWTLFSFCIYMLNSGEVNLKSLAIKYFQSGHTFMSSDAFHHQVELSLKRKKKVHDFSDFVDCVKNAKLKTVNVKAMNIGDFCSFTEFTSQYKLSKTTPRPYLQDMVFVKFERGLRSFKYKTSFSSNFIDLKFVLSKYETGQLPNPTRKVNERGISKERQLNIISKIRGIAPENRLVFWENLTINDNSRGLE